MTPSLLVPWGQFSEQTAMLRLMEGISSWWYSLKMARGDAKTADMVQVTAMMRKLECHVRRRPRWKMMQR